jgi:hypothetical protein
MSRLDLVEPSREDRTVTRRRVVVGCLLAVVAMVGPLSVIVSAPAVAAEPHYQHAVATTYFGGTGSQAGSYVTCPEGTAAVASGASSGQRLGFLQSGLTTFDGRGGYQTAWGWDWHQFQASAQCVTADRLAGNTLATVTLRDQTGSWRAYTRRVACPTGTVAYGGGAFTTYRGALTGGLATFGSVPDAGDWTYSGAGTLNGTELVVSSHCLPRAKLGNIVTVISTVRGPDSYADVPVSTAARCPAGYFAFAGGAFYHQRGKSTPEWKGYLTILGMTADDRGWFALGRTFAPGVDLTVRVRCTDRLG